MSEKESQITLKASYEGKEFVGGELVSALSLQELDEEGKAGKLLTAYIQPSADKIIFIH